MIGRSPEQTLRARRDGLLLLAVDAAIFLCIFARRSFQLSRSSPDYCVSPRT